MPAELVFVLCMPCVLSTYVNHFMSYRYAVVESFATFWDRQVSQLIRGIASYNSLLCDLFTNA